MPQAKTAGSEPGKPAAKRAAARTTSTKPAAKPAAAKSASRTTAATSTAVKSAAAKSTAAKSTAAKKPAAKKPAAKRPATAAKAVAPKAPTAASTARAAASKPLSDPRVEAVAARLRKLNERIIEVGRDAGETTLANYERALKAIAAGLEKTPAKDEAEWVAHLLNSQAKFVRDLTDGWAKAARERLK